MAKELKVMGVVEAVLQADADALAEIDSKIGDIEASIASQQREIEGLRMIRRAIDVRLNGKPERKQRQPREKKVKVAEPASGFEKANRTGDDEKLSQRIYDLLHAEGSMPIQAIAERLGVRAAVAGMCVATSNWFERKNGEVHIARTGK